MVASPAARPPWPQVWQDGAVSAKNDVPTWLLALGGFSIVLGLAFCELGRPACAGGSCRHPVAAAVLAAMG